jgi:two-component system, NtrC family, sensor kinase
MTETEQTELKAEVDSLRAELDVYKQQLIEAHQMTAVGQLLASIIHEINTPIGSILSNNEVSARSLVILKQLLEKAQADGAELPPKSERILKTLISLASVDKIACERIIAVVRGLKTFVGGHGSDFVEADLNEIVDNTLKLAHCEFRHRIQVETEFAELPKVRCDPHQLGQVFLNILVNAGHAIDDDGKVIVQTKQEGEFIHVSITDNGSGIPETARDRIFSSGFTTKAAGVGTGLGLAISHDIVVDNHGGTIDFETEIGQGTTFHIRIPVDSQNGK